MGKGKMVLNGQGGMVLNGKGEDGIEWARGRWY